MKNNSYNSDIREISDIICIWFHLYHLLHYYSNSGVGHHALLPFELIISLLYHYYSRLFFIIPPKSAAHFKTHYNMLGLLEIIAIIVIQKWNNWIRLTKSEDTLKHVIYYYTLLKHHFITYCTLFLLLQYSQCGKRAFSANTLQVRATHLVYHVREELRRWNDHLVR